jgi:hypothetical protein
MGPSQVGYERARSKGEVKKSIESNKIQNAIRRCAVYAYR